MISLLLFNHFYPVLFTDEFKRKGKQRIVVYDFSHSLWSAQRVKCHKRSGIPTNFEHSLEKAHCR